MTIIFNFPECDVEPHVEHKVRDSTLELVFAYLDRGGLDWDEGDCLSAPSV
ncbi:hypothetical protein QEG98_15355 [Myxococcus sp. MxC21-1]|uniref:hypothetical protein n=1 Tax=Myxococcus sp. MxC21-1 TaxID=3041439 RepID=UPI002931B809|nr:hypothetical protein [Myxococcus sp. MxC21-1]WNZ64898.1 hypothetical protein QEG98_15355 [Myxococcus sp. MxC21-1]